MLRVVEFHLPCAGRQFAVWDTVPSQFVSIDGEQAWDSLEEFRAEVPDDYPDKQRIIDLWPEEQPLQGLRSFCPGCGRHPRGTPAYRVKVKTGFRQTERTFLREWRDLPYSHGEPCVVGMELRVVCAKCSPRLNPLPQVPPGRKQGSTSRPAS